MTEGMWDSFTQNIINGLKLKTDMAGHFTLLLFKTGHFRI